MKLWIAQGFGVGRIPWAPGTFGSLLGLLWAAVLLCSGSWAIFLAGAILASALSVWLCGEAERILGKTDPGCVVLDEIIAMPFCFIAVVCLRWQRWPDWNFCAQQWVTFLAVFALFRLFDISKPPPVRQSQKLPGGWGVTIDDLLAAGYVNLVVIIFSALSK